MINKIPDSRFQMFNGITNVEASLTKRTHKSHHTYKTITRISKWTTFAEDSVRYEDHNTNTKNT